VSPRITRAVHVGSADATSEFCNGKFPYLFQYTGGGPGVTRVGVSSLQSFIAGVLSYSPEGRARHVKDFTTVAVREEISVARVIRFTRGAETFG
jgi:hypothetical protein